MSERLPEMTEAQADLIALTADSLPAFERSDLTRYGHNHREFVDGCFRCDLSRDEVAES